MMAELRKQICQGRIHIRLRQHEMAIFLEQSERREYLGDNLKVKDYIDLQTEVKNLDDKLAERAEEVAKLQDRFNNETNIFTHLKCSNKMNQLEHDFQLQRLMSSYQKFKNMRSQLRAIETERWEIRRQRQEFIGQCGILTMVPLMHDYDQLLLSIKAKQSILSELKKKHTAILKSIGDLEKTSCSP